MENRKLPTESEVADWLRQDQLSLAPLRFKLKQREVRFSDQNRQWDFIIEAAWNDQTANFAVEYKTLFTPKVFDETLRICKSAILPEGYYPLILMPYLRQSQLDELERNSISGVDWCGNGVVTVPDKYHVFRTGNRNQFASYAPIKNIYRKNTSMVGRALLVKRRYSEVQDLRDEVNARNMLVACGEVTPMSFSTVSKALKGLEDDLIVDRQNGVRLLQSDKLLYELNLNYELPRVTSIVSLKVDCGQRELPEFVREKAELAMTPIVATGLSSVSRYAVMQRDDVLAIYCPRSAELQKQLAARETDRFPNLQIWETDEQRVYFDPRQEDNFPWSSPLQTYFELMTGDKRDRETADQVANFILNNQGGTAE